MIQPPGARLQNAGDAPDSLCRTNATVSSSPVILQGKELPRCIQPQPKEYLIRDQRHSHKGLDAQGGCRFKPRNRGSRYRHMKIDRVPRCSESTGVDGLQLQGTDNLRISSLQASNMGGNSSEKKINVQSQEDQADSLAELQNHL